MAQHRRGRGAPKLTSARGARHSSGSEGALRALGDQIEKPPSSGERVANEPGLLALGEQIHRAKGGRRRRSRWRKGLLISLAVLVILLGAGAGYAYYVTHDLNRVNVRGLQSAFTSGQEAGTENILMVGSTSRCALAQQNLMYGICSPDNSGVNSDVIMILHADPNHHALRLLSIPRDLFIPNARSDGANKIDAGLYQGMTQVVAAIEEDFGIPIQHAVSLNFDQFANVVNALGGINMDFPESLFDAESDLNVQAAKCVHLDGTQALEVVRARHLQYDPPGVTTPYAAYWPQEVQSDLARIRRDHEFLRVLATAVAHKGLGNPLSDLALINSLKADLTFDQSWSVNDMASLLLDFHSVNINSVPQLTLPVSVVTDPDGVDGDLIYDGAPYGDVEFPAQVQDQSAVEELLGVGPTIDTMTGTALPPASTVTVSVMNGSGVDQQATQTGAALTALGFHVMGLGDTTPTGDLSETVVYYGSRSAATVAAAEVVLHSITGSAIMAYDPSQVVDGAQVTVVTGSQFGVNSPPAAPPSAGSTSTPGSTVATTTTTTTVPTSGDIGAPSPTTSKLAAWDPRACAAGAVPTVPIANHVG
jgi:polyisoprenyl-teichoic acid--peptidoglycan teichoic acid transferase